MVRGRPTPRVVIWWKGLRTQVLAARMAARVRSSVVPPPTVAHGLDGTLIVSLTSYPARFPTLALTLKSLLSQTVRADATILWLAEKDIAKLPEEVRALEQYGLTIRACDDIGSYKKIIPALEVFPDAYITTADDDLYYPPQWLEALVAAQREHTGAIVCHRARVMESKDGRLLPYREWLRAGAADEGPLVPTGFGGVLYPPGSLAGEVTDRATFMALCPTADDLWLKWMSAAVGTPVRLVMEHGPPYDWPGSQRTALVRTNIAKGGNDRQIQALVERFGAARL